MQENHCFVGSGEDLHPVMRLLWQKLSKLLLLHEAPGGELWTMVNAGEMSQVMESVCTKAQCRSQHWLQWTPHILWVFSTFSKVSLGMQNWGLKLIAGCVNTEWFYAVTVEFSGLFTSKVSTKRCWTEKEVEINDALREQKWRLRAILKKKQMQVVRELGFCKKRVFLRSREPVGSPGTAAAGQQCWGWGESVPCTAPWPHDGESSQWL